MEREGEQNTILFVICVLGRSEEVQGGREKEEELGQSEGPWGSDMRARVFSCPLRQVQA